MFVWLVQSGVGGGVLLARLRCMYAQACMCVRVHMSQSAHYTWLFFPDQVLCSILHDLQSYEPSSRSFFMRERARESFERAESWGLRDTTVNRPQQGAKHRSLLQLFII